MKRKDQLVELKGLSIKALSDKITENRQTLLKLRQQKILGQLKNTSTIKALKKEIARAKTALDEAIRKNLSQ